VTTLPTHEQEPASGLFGVLLVDDHAVVRKGLRALLDREAGLEVVGEAEDGEQAVRAADRLRPDVILMDLEMPRVGGIEATQQISASHPDCRIVVLTSHAAEPSRLAPRVTS
jgi:two-component system, NarL family, response regulator LiaR